MSDIYLKDILADGDLLRRVGANPEGISPAALAGVMGAARTFVHNGSTYQADGRRVFVGGEDPTADGVTAQAGDIWADPGAGSMSAWWEGEWKPIGSGATGGLALPLTRTWSGDRLDGIFAAMHSAAGMNPALIPPDAPVPGITATQSSNIDSARVAYRVTDWSNQENAGVGFGESHTGNAASSWWQADFRDLRFQITRIGILARSGGGLNPRNFKVQESADGSSWTDLLTVTAGPTNGNWWSSAISGSTAKRFIRILQTGANSGPSDNGSSPTNHLVLGEVEMWGTLSAP